MKNLNMKIVFEELKLIWKDICKDMGVNDNANNK